MNLICRSCGSTVDLPDRVGFRDICPSCSSYLHSCLQCASWVKSSCAEPQAEKVRDPRGQNFCDWFRAAAGGTETGKSSGGKAQAEAIWKKLTGK